MRAAWNSIVPIPRMGESKIRIYLNCLWWEFNKILFRGWNSVSPLCVPAVIFNITNKRCIRRKITRLYYKLYVFTILQYLISIRFIREQWMFDSVLCLRFRKTVSLWLKKSFGIEIIIALMMEAGIITESSVKTYQNTRRNIPDDRVIFIVSSTWNPT